MVDAPLNSTPSRGGRARIALAHDWLVGYRGGEAVLERIARLVSTEDEVSCIYTMFDSGRQLAPAVDAAPHSPSPFRMLPGAQTRLRRWLLPLYPFAVGRLTRRLRRDHARAPIDLLVSSSSAAIKGIRPPPGVPHLCYCHSPARYLWNQEEEYARTSALKKIGLRLFGGMLREWDERSSAGVTRFIANSSHIARVIEASYGAQAHIVYPPVRTGYFTPDPAVSREGFWLVAGALEPYKRTELAIGAAAKAGVTLVIAGEGSELPRLRSLAGPNIRFAGRVSDEELRSLYRRAAVLIFPQVEDFGIVAVEAQACGLPVVARRAGGALDTVIDGATGALFDEPTPESVLDALCRAPADAGEACRANALRFTEEVFDDAFEAQMEATLAEHASVPWR